MDGENKGPGALTGNLTTLGNQVHIPTSLQNMLGHPCMPKTVETDDQELLSHLQDMLEQLGSRGYHSVLISVSPLGEASVHATHKGQVFLKENPDIVERLSKLCSDGMQITNQTPCLSKEIVQPQKRKIDTLVKDKQNVSYQVCSGTPENWSKTTETETEMPPSPDDMTVKLDDEATKHADKNAACDTVSLSEMPATFSKPKGHVCSLCMKTFSKKFNLQRHVSQHHTATEEGIKCKVTGCEKTFACQSLLKNHMLTHEQFDCDVCGKHFSILGKLNHHRKIHSDSLLFSCDFCDKRFKTKDSLTKHLRIHEARKRFKCHLCEKEFNHSSTLKRHLAVHSGDKAYKCEVCDTEFRNKLSLEAHLIRTNHKLDKTDTVPESRPDCLECEICCKKFPANCKSLLLRHYLVHSDNKTFKCSICPKAYNDRSNLKYHIKTHHEQQEVYACELCKTEYGNRRIYAVHLRSSRHLQRAAVIEKLTDQSLQEKSTITAVGDQSVEIFKAIVSESDLHEMADQPFNSIAVTGELVRPRDIVNLAFAEASKMTELDISNDGGDMPEPVCVVPVSIVSNPSCDSEAWPSTSESTVLSESRVYFPLRANAASECVDIDKRHLSLREHLLGGKCADTSSPADDRVNEANLLNRSRIIIETEDNTEELERLDTEEANGTSGAAVDEEAHGTEHTGLTESDEEMFANEYFNSGFHLL